VSLARYSIQCFRAMWFNISTCWSLLMIGNLVSDGRLLSLQPSEWLMLIVGGLAGVLILMF
jgi:hypothetical protein